MRSPHGPGVSVSFSISTRARLPTVLPSIGSDAKIFRGRRFGGSRESGGEITMPPGADWDTTVMIHHAEDNATVTFRRCGCVKLRRSAQYPPEHHGSYAVPRTVRARASSEMDPSAAVGSLARRRSRSFVRVASSSDIAYAGAGPWPPRNG